jgi:hypothetical protein
MKKVFASKREYFDYHHDRNPTLALMHRLLIQHTQPHTYGDMYACVRAE